MSDSDSEIKKAAPNCKQPPKTIEEEHNISQE